MDLREPEHRVALRPAGVAAAQPRRSNAAASAARAPTPIITTTDTPRGCTARSVCSTMSSVWPAITRNAEATPRCVTGIPASAAAAIAERGVDVFNEQCRKMVQTYVGEWRRSNHPLTGELIASEVEVKTGKCATFDEAAKVLVHARNGRCIDRKSVV